jgi:hypothetical protein
MGAQSETAVYHPAGPELDSLVVAPFKDWRGLVYAGRFGVVGTPIESFKDLIELTNDATKVTFAKGEGPAVMTAFTANHRRRNEDFNEESVVTGLVIDLDEGVPDMAPIRGLVDWLKRRDIAYHLQWRKAETTYKVHLILPYAEPTQAKDPVTIREQQAALTARLIPAGIQFDYATTKAAGLCYLMTPRPGQTAQVYTEVHFGANALDFVTMYPPWLQGETRRKRSRAEATAETTLLLGAIEVNEWVESKGAWDITCPIGHGDDYRSKTYLYPNGVISCMAGRCQGKPLAWFLSHLDEGVRNEIIASSITPLKVELARVETKVTLTKAHSDMHEALADNRAIEGHATVVQVSTGAGKTRAIAEYLNAYSAPFEGERTASGLSAVLAVPTNALLREVEPRLTIPHIRKFGVLAVLNDDGTPACKKHTVAKTLQESGGNIHRLLCGHCEFKEGCPARDNATVGDGSLTLTNHALMPTVARDLLEKGRHPLLVWDESPQWVDTGNITLKDLDWLTTEFDREANPPRTSEAMLDAMVDVRLFPDRYRAAVRPVLEALRWIRTYWNGVLNCGEYVRRWAGVSTNRIVLAKARDATGTEASGDPWKDLMACFADATMLNRSEMGYDGMRPDTQQRVLRAERIMRTLGLMAGEDAVLVVEPHHVSISSLTASGSLFRRYGGVVLDATANLAELRRLRPDLRAVTLRVADAGSTERYLQHLPGLDRKSLKHRPERLSQCVDHAKMSVARWAKAGRVEVKPVVFTYMAHSKVVKTLWPEAEVGYFGNTRGYDRFFQEGFNTFITIGDPITNLSALALQWRVLTGAVPVSSDSEWQRYVSASAESELAQAHGRARNPQVLKGPGGRIHMHYGRKVPAGWDSETTRVDPVSLNFDFTSGAEVATGTE